MAEQMDVTKSEPYYFKKLSPELYSDLVYISKSAFNIDPGVDYYFKKNKTELFGPTNLGFIAYSSGGEPAAFYGVYSHPMILDGIKILAAQSGDTMTHKNHTGKGLFIQLAKMTFNLAKEMEVNFVFGFPNNNSYPGFVKKLDWVCPYKLNEYRIRISTLPLCKLAKKVSLLKPFYNIYKKIIFSLFSGNGELFNSSVIENGVGGVNRTRDFFNYKSFNGAFLIKIQNLSLWVKTDGFLFIGDIERNENADYSEIINRIKRICFWSGIDTVIFQVSPESFLDDQLSKFLECEAAFYMGYLNLSEKYNPLEFKFVFADVDTF